MGDSLYRCFTVIVRVTSLLVLRIPVLCQIRSWVAELLAWCHEFQSQDHESDLIYFIKLNKIKYE